MPPRTPSIKPRWLRAQLNKVKQISEGIKENIKAIAEICAKHDRSEEVLPRHLDDAYSVLERTGLQRQSFWSRPEIEFGFGAWLMGAAGWVSEFFVRYFTSFAAWLPGMTGTLAATGCLLMVRAWLRGSCRI